VESLVLVVEKLRDETPRSGIENEENLKYILCVGYGLTNFFSELFHWATNFWSCFLILIFWCFLMFFGALSPKMTLVFS